MKVIHPYVLFMFVFLLAFLSGPASKGQGGHEPTDTANISILKIVSDSFPNISVFFKAETPKFKAVSGLNAEKVNVSENGRKFETRSVQEISKTNPIHVGLMLDHSTALLLDVNHNPIAKGHTTPLDIAKRVTKKIASGLIGQNATVSIPGFSSRMKDTINGTIDTARINFEVNGMSADHVTSICDGILSGLEQLNKTKGLRIMIVLTGGHDIRSKHKWADVIAQSRRDVIPIYFIGLGDANLDTLKQIAAETKGGFFYAPNMALVNAAYAMIDDQLKSFYNLEYTSLNAASADTGRQVDISLVSENTIVSVPGHYHLPDHAIAELKNKEIQKQNIIYGISGLAALIILIILIMILRKSAQRKKQAGIVALYKIYPNPSNGFVFLEYQSGPGQLTITNTIGETVKTLQVRAGMKGFDLSDVKDGEYSARIQSGGKQSEIIKFVIKR